MPMEGWVKCLSPKHTFGVSGVNSVSAKSNTIEENRDQFFKHRKKEKKSATSSDANVQPHGHAAGRALVCSVWGISGVCVCERF